MSDPSAPIDAGGDAPHSPGAALVATGLTVVAYGALLAWLAHRLDIGMIDRDQALLVLAAGSVAAGVIYLTGLFKAGLQLSRVSPAWIGFVAIAARVAVFAAPPMLENDYQRYLWDGAVGAHGVNPYRYTPGNVASGAIEGNDVNTLQSLAVEGWGVLAEVNHPHLSTIYPPVAQMCFALAHVIEPFGVTGWRLILLLADAIAVLLLIRLLKVMGLPLAQVIWYAWNPLLLHETYSALHMDMLVLPVVLGALLAGMRGRGTIGAALCIVGSAIKIWPIILVPLFLPLRVRQWKSLVVTVALCGMLFVALWLPVFVVTLGSTSGFVAYGEGWQNNDGFFRAGIWLTEQFLNLIHVEPWHSHFIMRVVSAALLLAVLAVQVGRRADAHNLHRQCLFIVGAVFLLSPTQFPWYWLWCLPLLTLGPSLPLLLYTALSPLYYVQPLTSAVYWIEHLPVWGLLGWHLARSMHRIRQMPAASMRAVHA